MSFPNLTVNTKSDTVLFNGQPPMGSSGAVIRTLTKLGLNVPSNIQAAAQENGNSAADGVEHLQAMGVRYPTWQVDQALAKTNLTTNQKVYFKRQMDELCLLASNDEVEQGPRFTTASEIMERLRKQGY